MLNSPSLRGLVSHCCIMSVLGGFVLHGIAAADDAELIRAAAAENRQNRSAFKFLKCQYTITQGTAPSVQGAIDGKIKPKTIKEMTWVVDGSRTRISTVADDAAVRKALSASTTENHSSSTMQEIAIPPSSQNFLELGELQMSHSPALMQCANLHGKNDHFQAMVIYPFALQTGIQVGAKEQFSPAIILDGWLRHQDYPIEKTRSDDGESRLVLRTNTKVLRRQADSKTIHEAIQTYEFSPDQGYLLKRYTIEEEGQPARTRYVLTDIEECSGGRWFPKRAVILGNPQPDTELVHVTEIKVHELDVDTPPQDADFAILLTKGTQINNVKDPRTAFDLEEETTITPNNLPELINRADSVLAARIQSKKPQQPPVPNIPNPLWRTVAIFVAVAVIAVVFFLLWRRKLRTA